MTKNTIKKQYQPCDRFSDLDYSRYVHQKMSKQEMQEFVAHANSCSSCLHGIRQANVTFQRQKEQEENRLLQSQALSIMDRLDQSVFSIVIRAVQGVVELVRSTGEQMIMTPAFAGVRSSSGTSEAKQIVRLAKEFEESRISVEVTLSPVEPDKLDIVVSLLDRQREEFVCGALVSCCGNGEGQEKLTDENGQVSFNVSSAGFYELVMKKENNLLGAMTITGL